MTRPSKDAGAEAGAPSPIDVILDDAAILDLTELVRPPEHEDQPPSLTSDASVLWPSTSSIHSSLSGSTSSFATAQTWEDLVEELAEESQQAEDPELRRALLCEAGRVLIDRLGRQEEGELLLRRSQSPVAEVLQSGAASGTDGLAAELARLREQATDDHETTEARAAAWIEFGLLCEERKSSRPQAFDAYQHALELVPQHPLALALAVRTALLLEKLDDASQLIEHQIESTESRRYRTALLLELADITQDARRRLTHLEQAHEYEPTEETALRRLTRAVAALGDDARLGALYRDLARVAEDPISASTALHLAFLTLAEAGGVVHDLVLELAARDPARPDHTDILAPLSEVALYVEQRIAAGDDPRGLPENVTVLERLSRCLDDPREQALVREQLARIRFTRLKAKIGEDAPANTVPIKLDEDDAAWCDKLEADLRFCLVHLPEHRWVSEALSELLEMRGNLPALVLHLQEWARRQSAGPGRAAILLRLGRIHETRRRDLARAAEIYELAVAEDPDNPNCLRALGHVYEKMRRWPQAVASLRRQADESDDVPEKLAALRRIAALAEHELGDVDLAIATLEESTQLDPDDLISLYQLAKLCRTHRRPTVLITALEQLIERVEDDIARTALLVELGEVKELHLKKRRSAQIHYERALQLSPGYTPALRALGRLYRDNGQLEELLRILDPEVDPVTDPAVLHLKAARVCLEEIGDIDRATKYAEQAYATNPDLVPARELLLQLLTTSGQLQKAYDLLRAQDLPKAGPLLADHHYRLGLLAEAVARRADAPRHNGKADPREDAALQHYRAALVYQPDHGLAFERSRRLLVAHHDVGNLTHLIETVLPSEGEEAKAMHLVHLARLVIAAGHDVEGARRAYEEALSASGDDPIVRREFEGLLRIVGDRKSLPALLLRTAQDTKDTHLKATLLVEAAELLLSTDAREDHELAGRAVLEALQVDPGNPYAVRHLERLLSEPGSTFVVKDAVGARAVRAQSDAERAIFYLESAELLERVGAWGQARRAYLAAKGALPQLAPADLGLARTSNESRKTTSVQETRTSIFVLVAQAREAAARASRGEKAAVPQAIAVLDEILQRDPQHRDALAIARNLAAQVTDTAALVEVLTRSFPKLDDRELIYDIGLFLGEHSRNLEDALRYYEAAASAKPSGRRALRGLVNAYRKLGDDRRAAAASERLLALFDPQEPAALDLRMGIAAFLSSSRETLARALDHARVVVQARPDDPRALALLADLYERSGLASEAADAIDKLAARERNRERLHDLYLRQGKLLAEVPGEERRALAAIERAAGMSPGNRDTVTLLIDQLTRAGQTARVAGYLAPVRGALAANISRGGASLRDLNLLAKVAEVSRPDLADLARGLLRAIEGNAGDPPPRHPTVDKGRFERVLGTPALRASLYAPGEPTAVHALLQNIDGVVSRLEHVLPMVGYQELVPVRDVDVEPLQEYGRRLLEPLGLKTPRIASSTVHNAAVLLAEPVCTIGIGHNLWAQGDPRSWRGLMALAAARAALGAPRVRALAPADLDLLLSACFEVVGVFNPLTADSDPKRFKDVVSSLRNALPRRQHKALEAACRVLSAHAFDAGATAEELLATDLHTAAVFSGDYAGCLGAACLLDGIVGGTLKQRINRSKTAQRLLVFLISDEFLKLSHASRGA